MYEFVHNPIMVNEWCKCCIMCCVYFMCSAFDGIYCCSYIHVCTCIDGTYCEHGREIFDEEAETSTKESKGKSKKPVSLSVPPPSLSLS